MPNWQYRAPDLQLRLSNRLRFPKITYFGDTIHMSMVFEEHQKLNVWWVWAILCVAASLSLVALISSLAGAGGAGTAEIIGASIAALSLVGVLIMMASMTMHTRIDEYGIEAEIRPFVNKKFFWREV